MTATPWDFESPSLIFCATIRTKFPRYRSTFGRTAAGMTDRAIWSERFFRPSAKQHVHVFESLHGCPKGQALGLSASRDRRPFFNHEGIFCFCLLRALLPVTISAEVTLRVQGRLRLSRSGGGLDAPGDSRLETSVLKLPIWRFGKSVQVVRTGLVTAFPTLLHQDPAHSYKTQTYSVELDVGDGTFPTSCTILGRDRTLSPRIGGHTCHNQIKAPHSSAGPPVP